MLLLSIMACVNICYGATDQGLREVSVAYFYDESYFGSNYDKGTKGGFGYEYLQAIGNFSGWKFNYVYGDYDSLLEQFMVGKIDIMPGMPRSFDIDAYYEDLEARAKNSEIRYNIHQSRIDVLYPNQPMNSVDYYLCLPKGTNSETFMITSVSHTSLGVPSSISDFAKEWDKKLGLYCDIKVYDSEADCINALNNGEVNAIFAQSNAAETGLVVTRKAGSVDYYLGVTSKKRTLLSDINNALEMISSSTNGMITNMQTSFDTTAKFDKTLSQVEKDWVEGHKKIFVGTLYDFKPYSHYDPQTAETDGFIYNAFTEFMNTLDIDIDIRFDHFDNYDQLIKALNNGEIDAAFPVPAYLYQSELNEYVFTKVFAEENMMLVYKDDYTEGSLATIAYPATGIAKHFDEEYYSSSQLLEYPSDEACMQAVYDEGVTCTILRSRSVDDIVKNDKKLAGLSRITLPQKLEMSVGVKRGNIGLYTLINRASYLASKGNGLNYLMLEAQAGEQVVEKKGISSVISNEGFIYSIIILLLVVIIILLSTSMIRLVRASRKLKKANSEIKGVAKLQQQNFDIIGILARDYSSVFKVNLETEDIQTFRLETSDDSKFGNTIRLGAKYTDVFNQYVRDNVYEDDKPKMYDEIGIPIIRKKLRKRNSYAVRFRKIVGEEEPRYYEFRVSTVDIDITGKVLSVVIAFIDCNDEILHEMKYMKSLEKALKSDAVISGLTGDFDWVAYVANVESKDSSGVTHYRIGDMFNERFSDWENENDYNRIMDLIAETIIIPEDRKLFLNEANKSHIRKKLNHEVAHFVNFRIVNSTGMVEYYQMKCVADIADGRLYGFILGFHSIDDEIRKEREQQEKLEQKVAERTAQLEEKNESLNRMNNDIIELMGNVVEGRDEESGQHVRRVK
nr:transporter substrate-binding domain-containing protein [Lachnospiraceae bacterium]